MAQNFISFLRFFIVTGLFHSNFVKKKSFQETLWSLSIFLFYFLAVVMIFCSAISDLLIQESKFLVACYHFFLVFCIFSALVSTFLLKRYDALFWKFVNEAESIFKGPLGMETNNKNFTKRCWFKIIANLSVFVLCQSVVIGVSIVQKREGARNFAIISAISRAFFRLFLIKFNFYVDVLHFYLKNIKAKLTRTFVSTNEIKYLRMTYTICWKMSRVIEKNFGFVMFLTAFYTILGAIYTGYNLCTDYVYGNTYLIPALYPVSKIFGMIVTTLTCQRSINCSLSLAPLILEKSSRDLHKLIESFGLQILHQRIKFKPMDIFNINHEFFVEVSKKRKTK